MKIFDYDQALGIADGDPELLGELVSLFRETSPALLAEIKTAIGEQNHEQLRRAAHTLKGSAANVGAATLSEAARTMETAVAAGDFTGATNLYEQVAAEILRFAETAEKTLEVRVP
jgi:HPt (histidine-containing phosphotransfer) domain-containing protein